MTEEEALMINRLESQISDNKVSIEIESALMRLKSNPDFIRIIEEGYFKDAAIRLVAFTGSVACTGQARINTYEDIQAIGKLRDYFSTIQRNARTAESTIAACLEDITAIETGEE